MKIPDYKLVCTNRSHSRDCSEGRGRGRGRGICSCLAICITYIYKFVGTSMYMYMDLPPNIFCSLILPLPLPWTVINTTCPTSAHTCYHASHSHGNERGIFVPYLSSLERLHHMLTRVREANMFPTPRTMSRERVVGD